MLDNAGVKVKPNLTSGGFCQYVSDDFLPSKLLEPGFPRKISVHTGINGCMNSDLR